MKRVKVTSNYQTWEEYEIEKPIHEILVLEVFKHVNEHCLLKELKMEESEDLVSFVATYVDVKGVETEITIEVAELW